MQELGQNKHFNILKWIFVVVSIIHVVYATITMRGMYMDGGYYMINLLNNFSNDKFEIITDPMHTRFCVHLLRQIPVILGYFIVQNKFFLMMLYSFTQIALPLIFLLWSYKLSKRTNRPDLFFLNLLCYGSLLLTFSIFSMVETPIGVTLNFILWNYLSSKIAYKKVDIIGIVFLLIIMFGTYEYITILGLIFFIASLFYTEKETDFNSKYVKSLIGLGSLAASVFNILFMLNVSGEEGEIARFINDYLQIPQYISNLNILISIVTVILIIVFLFFKKKIFSSFQILALSFFFIGLFCFLLSKQLFSVNPMLEGQFRTLPCFVIPILFFFILILDVLKKEINKNTLSNLICIALLCAITQTLWQMVNTYYWNKNIQYMKNELMKEESLLYVPSKHPEISSFHNQELRRFIWHSTYTFTSILFSDTYEQKNILLHYDEQFEDGNETFRDELFVAKYAPNIMHIPFGGGISIKNKYWDLTKCADALDKYNKENNIETYDRKQQNLL